MAALVAVLAPGGARAALTIDIVKAPRRLPIAVMDLTGPYGAQIAEIVREDLRASGLFEPMDPEAFLERPGQPFRRSNWAGTGTEAVLKGAVTADEQLTVTVTLYDALEGKAEMAKKYKASRELIRPLAHSIANDIYRQITGREGMFRSKLVYLSLEDGQYRLNISDWDGRRARNLGVRANTIIAPRWHWSGNNIVYSAQRGRKWGVYRLHLTTLSEELLVDEPGTNIAGGFYPDGDRFTFSSSREGTPDIYTFYIKRKKLSRLTKGFGIEVSPVVSPDGTTIAYVSDRPGTPQIYTMDKFGYNKNRVTYSGSYNTSPAWAPDGKIIAFSGWDEGKNQVFVIRPDSRGLVKLTSKGNNEEPSFSPDGRFIAFTSDRDGEKAVYIMRTNGEDQRRLTPRGVRSFSPRWSPK